MYELKNGRRISVRAASKLFANTMFSYKGMGLYVVRLAVYAVPEELQCCCLRHASFAAAARQESLSNMSADLPSACRAP